MLKHELIQDIVTRTMYNVQNGQSVSLLVKNQTARARKALIGVERWDRLICQIIMDLKDTMISLLDGKVKSLNMLGIRYCEKI